MNKKLHIVSLDIPYPADYGGVIDIYYKIKQLHEAGVEITLHCFQYGDRKPAPELEKYCKQVYYYKRKTGFSGLHFQLPYIISSRNDPRLLANLCADNSPVLFEGLHSTFFLNHPRLQGRKLLLRAHNVESDYYRELAKNTNRFFKKLYYSFESARLLRYENQLSSLVAILAISEADALFFKTKYPHIPVHFVPAFHAYTGVSSLEGTGSYCLYHGNLGVSENIQSVLFLAKRVFSKSDIPFIIAGKNPDPEIFALESKQLKVIANPNESTLNELIQNAHIHVLPGFQQTGMKLKVLHALFAGRFLITNDTGLGTKNQYHSVLIANNAAEYIEGINSLIQRDFSSKDIAERQDIFNQLKNKGVDVILDIMG